MIINKEVLAELLLKAGYGTLIFVSSATIESNKGTLPHRSTCLLAGDLEDFAITVDVEPVTEQPEREGNNFDPSEVITAVQSYYGLEGNVITLDMREPNTYKGVTLETISHKQVKKQRQLKRLGQLKGLTIESVKTVKQGTKAYIKTTDGAGICVEHAAVIQELAPDENIALGFLTKEDLASIAKAKKMGLLL